MSDIQQPQLAFTSNPRGAYPGPVNTGTTAQHPGGLWGWFGNVKNGIENLGHGFEKDISSAAQGVRNIFQPAAGTVTDALRGAARAAGNEAANIGKGIAQAAQGAGKVAGNVGKGIATGTEKTGATLGLLESGLAKPFGVKPRPDLTNAMSTILGKPPIDEPAYPGQVPFKMPNEDLSYLEGRPVGLSVEPGVNEIGSGVGTLGPGGENNALLSHIYPYLQQEQASQVPTPPAITAPDAPKVNILGSTDIRKSLNALTNQPREFYGQRSGFFPALGRLIQDLSAGLGGHIQEAPDYQLQQRRQQAADELRNKWVGYKYATNLQREIQNFQSAYYAHNLAPQERNMAIQNSMNTINQLIKGSQANAAVTYWMLQYLAQTPGGAAMIPFLFKGTAFGNYSLPAEQGGGITAMAK